MSNRRSGTRDGVGGWPWMFRVMAALLGTLASVVCLELLLRTLPVYGGSRTLAVNDENPVIRFAPNREFVWSRDWNFSIVNKVRVNNYGFVSDFDYDENATGPLLAVIGDSFVEAFTEPFRKSCAGRLATKLDGTARVYAFGASGAPLSQYLAFAEYARDIFRPNGIVILVVKNDFDESLRKYAYRAGHHQFVERSDGRLVLARNDFDVGILHRLVRVSAVLRYLVGNVDVVRTGERIRRLLGGEEARGETEKEARARMLVTDSKRAVDAFLELLPESAGLDPGPDRVRGRRNASGAVSGRGPQTRNRRVLGRVATVLHDERRCEGIRDP